MHMNLMFFGYNDGIFSQKSAYNKLGLTWYQTETFNKKW